MIFLTPLISAFFFRLRGSSLLAKILHRENVTTIGRLLFAFAITGCMASLYTVQIYIWPIVLLGWFLGEVMGLPKGMESWDNPSWPAMFLRGIVWGAILPVFYFYLGFKILAGVTLISLLAYPFIFDAARFIPSKIPFLLQGHELGEFLWGLFLGFLAILGVLWQL